MEHDPLVRLRAILKDERQAFLNGDYAELAGISAEKERLLSDLQNARPSRKDLQELRESMERNQKLAQAALTGVHSAKARIGALLQVQAGLTTYDPDGKVAVRTTGVTRVERKA